MKGIWAILIILIGSVQAAEFTVQQRTIEDWRPYEGRVESRAIENIIAPATGNNLILEIAEEGQSVESGNVIVRFATDKLEEQLRRVESDFAIAEASYSEAKDGRQPLELAELERAISNAKNDWENLTREAQELKELMKLGLVSQTELDNVTRQRDSAKLLKSAKERELSLTQSTVHPAELKRLHSALSRAEQELKRVQAQLNQSEIKANQQGVVVLLPIFISGQQRTARAGDELNQGRAFMQIVDVDDIQIHLNIDESQSAGVAVGKKAIIYPIADRNQQVEGTVIKRGRVAKTSKDGRNRTIDATISLKEKTDLFVPGASVEARVLVNSAHDVLAVPRGAIRWQNSVPFVEKNTGLIEVRLGLTDALWVEVKEGLSLGESIITP